MSFSVSNSVTFCLSREKFYQGTCVSYPLVRPHFDFRHPVPRYCPQSDYLHTVPRHFPHCDYCHPDLRHPLPQKECFRRKSDFLFRLAYPKVLFRIAATFVKQSCWLSSSNKCFLSKQTLESGHDNFSFCSNGP